MSIEMIDLNKLYFPYKEDLEVYYNKYFGQEGNPLLFKNHPLTLFAIDYINKGKKVIEELDSHPFIRYEYERYKDAESVINDTHKHKAAQRIINLVESIRKYGYCEGKYDHRRHMIRVSRGFVSPYGNDTNGYTLKTRKHRASACIALGIFHIKAKL